VSGIQRLLTKPITLRYSVPGGVDALGHPVVSTVDVDTKGYYRLTSVDDADAVSRDEIDMKVYLGAAVSTVDLTSVFINGEELQLDGPAHRQYNPRVSADVYWLLSVRRAA
jgi:hypothetical protein